MIRRIGLAIQQPKVISFLKNVSMMFVFKVLSLLLTTLIYIICVRELGVITWGQVALIVNAAGLLLIPLTFGLYTGVVKYVPISSEEESKELMGTAFLSNLAISSSIALFFVLIGPFVERLLGFPFSSWLWAIALGFSMNLFILTESFLRGQQKFFIIGSYKFYCSVLFLISTLVGLYVLNVKSIESYLIPFIGYNLLFFIVALWKSRVRTFRITKKAWNMLFSYGILIMLSWLVSALLFTSDLFLLARFGTEYEVGVYSVYQNNMRALFTIMFHDVFAVVFLPMIAALDKSHIDRMIMKFFAPIAIVIGITAAALTTLLVILFGEQFPLNWTFVSLTAVGLALNMMYLLVTSIISLDGVKAARLSLLALVVPMPLLLFMQYLFVKHWGILGGMYSVIVLNVLLIIALRLCIHLFYEFQYSNKEEGINVISE